MPAYFEGTVLQQGATGAVNGTPATVIGFASLTVQVLGISGDTLTVEGTIDGSNWVAILAVNMSTGAVATTITTDGLYSVPCAGLEQVRTRISTYGAGTITVYGRLVGVPNW